MKYVLWGAGGLLSEMGEIVSTRAMQKIEYIVDSDSGKWGVTHHGKTVKSPQALLSENTEELTVIIGVFEARHEVELRLRQMGLHNYVWFATFTGDNNIPPLIRRKPWFIVSDAFYTDERKVVRTEIAMELICWEGKRSMLDLGAGMMPAKRFLPEGIAYTPVDYNKLSSEIVVCDFNKYEFPDTSADVVLAVGILGHVKDWRWFLTAMAGAVTEGGSLVVSAIALTKQQAFYYSSTSLIQECTVILHLQECGLTFKDFKSWNMDTRLLLFEKKRKS